MPGGNRLGPNNQGPMTGRGFGFCAGFNSPGFTKGIPRGGRGGFGRGRRGGGRGRRNRYYRTRLPNWYRYPTTRPALSAQPATIPQPTGEQQLQTLEQERQYLEQQQEAIQKDLKDIKKEVNDLKKSKSKNKK